MKHGLALLCTFALFISLAAQSTPSAGLPAEGTRTAGDQLYAYQGTAPTIDGAVTAADGWDQVIPFVVTDLLGTYSIRAKHDGTNLYLLFIALNSTVHVTEIFFEDDGLYPDRTLDYENEDCKYVGSGGFPDGFCDAHWNGGWTVANEYNVNENGGAEASYSAPDSVSEWWLPLCTGSIDDINVTGNETLGFYASSTFSYDPEFWWDLHIVFGPVPPDTQAPVADAGPDIEIERLWAVVLDGTSSTDDRGIASYEWMYMEDGTEHWLYGSVVLTVFYSPGTYVVNLFVTDTSGNVGSDWLAVTVTDPEPPDFIPPVAEAGYDFTVQVGATAYFDGTGSHDNVGIVNYSWYIALGMTSAVFLYGPTPTYVFQSAGEFTVALTVTDEAGFDGFDTMRVTVTEPDDIEVIDVPYTQYPVTGSMSLNGTLGPQEYAMFTLPAGTKDYDIQVAIISPRSYADFFVLDDLQLDTYQDGDPNYFYYTSAVRDSRSFTYSTESTDRLHIVIDNSALTSGAPGDTPISYYIVLTSHAPEVVEAETDGTLCCWSTGGILAMMAIMTTYWLFSPPKKGAMGEDLRGRRL